MFPRPQNRRDFLVTTIIILLLVLLSSPAAIISSASTVYNHVSLSTRNSQDGYSVLAPQQSQANASPIKLIQIPTPNSGPNAIISAPNDTFWFVEYLTGKIGEFFAQNNSFREFQIPEKGAIPSSLAIDGLGRIWFSDQSGSGSIWMLDPTTAHFTQYNTTSQNSKPLFILVDKENNVWFTEISTNKLGSLTYPSYVMTEYTLPTPNSEPVELAFGPNQSTIWITETTPGKIASFNVASHEFTEYTPPPSASLISPVGIVVDKQGNVWVSEHGGSAVEEFVPTNSTFRKYPTSVSSLESYPISAVATIAIDSQGRLWFVEHFANKIGRLDPSTGTMQEFQIPGSELAYSVLNAVDSQDNFWFTDFGAGAIGEIPSNATSPLEASVQLSDVSTISAGKTVDTTVLLSNTLSVPVDVTLNASSTFSSTGQTSVREVSFNSNTLSLPARGTAVVGVVITPDASLASGLYSVGIIASSGNDSTIGIAFISVQGQFSITEWLASNYQIILVIVILILVGAYLFVRRKSFASKENSKKKVE